MEVKIFYDKDYYLLNESKDFITNFISQNLKISIII